MYSKRLNKLKNTLIGDSFFYSKVFAIVIPMIIQNTVTNVVSLLDNVMVGQLGTIPMSAVAIDNQLIFVFNLCIFGGLAGAGIFSAQFAGAKDNQGLKNCFRMKWYIAILMLILAFAIFILMPDTLISSYISENTSAKEAAETLYYGKEYLSVMLFGLLPFAVSQVYASTLKEVGETKLPMISSVIAILINLIFNYFLIFGKFGFPKKGVAGAAIATVLSRYVEAVIIVVFTHLKAKRFTFIKGVYSSLKIPAQLCKKIMVSGAPLLINEFLWSTGMAMLLKCYSVRSITVVAAANISSTAFNLFNVAFISMGGAIAIIIGQALGAGDGKKAQDIVWKLMALSVTLSAVLGIILALTAKYIPFLFNSDPVVTKTATSFIYVIAALLPFFAFSHSCYFVMRSGGRTIITFLFDSAVIWGVNVPIAYVLSSLTSINIVTVYLLVQSLDIIKCIIGFILVKKGIWIRNMVA